MLQFAAALLELAIQPAIKADNSMFRSNGSSACRLGGTRDEEE